ncbi:MAG: GTP-binding protein [Candidatus Muiribacteriota bacterium]
MEKTFYVSNMGEAIKLIRKEMGPDAFIIDTKVIDEKNDMLQYFGGKRLKVIAKKDETTDKEKLNEKAIDVNKILQLASKNNPYNIMKSPVANSDNNNNIESKDMTCLEKQVIELKSMVEAVTTALFNKENSDSSNLNCRECSYYQKLVDNDIDEKLALKLSSAFNDCLPGETFESFMKSNIEKCLNFEEFDKSNKIYFFIGTPGAGKTTSIIKLAINLKLKNNAKLLIITTDIYKEAGFHQIDNQCSMVEITTLKAGNQNQLLNILTEKYGDFDYIFIDTPGLENDCVNFFQHIPKSIQYKKILVLNANSRYREQIKKIEIFNNTGFDNLIFTKTDETHSLGNVYNIISKFPDKKITALMNGQAIPTDVITDKNQSIDYFYQKVCC